MTAELSIITRPPGRSQGSPHAPPWRSACRGQRRGSAATPRPPGNGQGAPRDDADAAEPAAVACVLAGQSGPLASWSRSPALQPRPPAPPFAGPSYSLPWWKDTRRGVRPPLYSSRCRDPAAHGRRRRAQADANHDQPASDEITPACPDPPWPADASRSLPASCSYEPRAIRQDARFIPSRSFPGAVHTMPLSPLLTTQSTRLTPVLTRHDAGFSWSAGMRGSSGSAWL